MTDDREQQEIELVDEAGRAVGVSTVDRAHTPPGERHRAFSVVLYDATDRMLLQQRAATKTRFPGRWANACCGHPGPGGDLPGAAAERLAQELGLTGLALVEVGAFEYRAVDPTTGRVEYEYDHVLVGRLSGDEPRPDPAEVADWRWIDTVALDAALSGEPDRFAPWLAGVVRIARPIDAADPAGPAV